MPLNEQLYGLFKSQSAIINQLLTVISGHQAMLESLARAVSAHQALLSGEDPGQTTPDIDRSVLDRATADIEELDQLWKQSGGAETE